MKSIRVGAVAFALLGLSSPSMAADMLVKAPPLPVAYNWSGLWLGAQGGWANDPVDWQNTSINNVRASGDITGGFFGLRGGYDFQWSNLVLGASAEINWSDISGSINPVSPGGKDHADLTIREFGSVDGRIGWAIDRVLIYAIGGVAWTTISHSYVSPGAGAGSVTFPDAARTGWDAGGGASFALTRNLIAGVEYRHYDFGAADFTPLGIALASHSITLKSDTVRGLVAYKF
jgi:outer membrane immunogenic protein